MVNATQSHDDILVKHTIGKSDATGYIDISTNINITVSINTIRCMTHLAHRHRSSRVVQADFSARTRARQQTSLRRVKPANQQSTINNQQSTINTQQSTINTQQSTINTQPRSRITRNIPQRNKRRKEGRSLCSNATPRSEQP